MPWRGGELRNVCQRAVHTVGADRVALPVSELEIGVDLRIGRHHMMGWIFTHPEGREGRTPGCGRARAAPRRADSETPRPRRSGPRKRPQSASRVSSFIGPTRLGKARHHTRKRRHKRER